MQCFLTLMSACKSCKKKIYEQFLEITMCLTAASLNQVVIPSQRAAIGPRCATPWTRRGFNRTSTQQGSYQSSAHRKLLWKSLLYWDNVEIQRKRLVLWLGHPFHCEGLFRFFSFVFPMFSFHLHCCKHKSQLVIHEMDKPPSSSLRRNIVSAFA